MSIIRSLLRFLSIAIAGLGYIAAFCMGLYGLFFSFDIVKIVLGPVAAFLSLIFFPVLLAVAPWYLGLSVGNWSLLFITYGAMPVFWICLGISTALYELGSED